MSGASKKLKKNANPRPQPAILFVPSDNFDPEVADVITVTDPAIYARVIEGALSALDASRQGVRREKKSRIIT
jgi:hypothetical protein